MSNYKTARLLKAGALVNIITTTKNASNQNREFYGEFVRLEEKASNYHIIIRRMTGFTNMNNKPMYEELRISGQNICRIYGYEK